MNSIFTSPRVFISYSHDSREHKDRVLNLADRLREEDGIDCNIDQYEMSPPEGWPRWMLNQIEEAEFVLVVCTEPYDRRFRGKEEAGKGRGATWEGAVITQELYEAQGKNTKFIPVVFSSQDLDFIPIVLRGVTEYRIYTEEGYEDLLRHLTDQPWVQMPPLGQLRQLPRRDRQQFFLDETQHNTLREELLAGSQGLLSWPRTLGNDREIERLELEQLLSRIKGNECSTTLVLGSPGSGKSALLATLGHCLVDERYALLAIKADFLGSTVNNLEELRRDDQVQLSMNPRDAIKAVANKEPVVLLVDQLDAVSELLDRQPGRLNVLLNLIQSLAGTRNVHIVATCREFEFRHGSQFSRLEQVDRLDLSLPTWEQVSPILLQAGHNPTSMGEPLQELLRTPLHLKLFLEVAQPGEAFDSLQNLLGKLWEKHISRTHRAKDCIILLERLARRMRDEEVLWLAASVTDDYPEACQVLEQAEILTRERGNLIGFRHQTYYDYTLARAFVSGSESLADLVLRRQDSLFVRPTLLSSLNYLRGTAREQYRQQLQRLLSNSEQDNCVLKNAVSRLAQKILRHLPEKTRIGVLSALRLLRLIYVRTHIHTLLIEFVGGQKDPDPVEKDLLIPLLNSKTEGQRVLAAIVGSPGWFACLRDRPELRQWLEKPPSEAAYCLPLLSTAVHFAAEDVWNLIEDYWLDDSAYAYLGIRVMLNSEQWTPQRVRLAEQVIRRSDISWYDISAITERVAESLPELAPRILRAHLDRRLERALEESSKPIPELPPDAEESQRYIHNLRHNRLNSLKNIIENESDFYDIEVFAERLPKFFLNSLWSWFVDVLERIARDETRFLTSYREDGRISVEYERGTIVKAVLVAVLALADQEPQVFLNFVQQNVGLDLIAVHCLLARGLERVADQEPQQVFEYLLGDPRRLCLGDTWDRYRETKRLIAAVCPHLRTEDRIRIEQAILAFNHYTPDPLKQPADFRFRCMKWNRQERLRLLRAFPDECLSPKTRQLKDEEERALPDTRDEDSNYPVVQTVGSRMTIDEMTRASDKDLLNLFDELSGLTDIDVMLRNGSGDMSRAGGAGAQSYEFSKLVETDPERLVRFIQNLEPHRHEEYVGKTIDKLCETDFPASDLIDLIESFDQRGFASEDFRYGASSALEKLARCNQGIPNTVLSLLEGWLATHVEPDLSRYKQTTESTPESQKSPIVFGVGGSHALPHGRGSIVRAIAAGYLKREPPDLDNWTRVIRSRLDKEKHPAVWVDILVNMPPLLNGDRIQAAQLFDRVIRNCPTVLHYQWALFFIAHAVGWFEPEEIVQGWLELLLAENSTFCHQAYGELLFIHRLQYQDDWSVDRIRHHLANPTDEAVLCGLAYAASYLWVQRRCRAIAAEILVKLSSCPAESVQDAVASVFRWSWDSFELDPGMRQIVQAVCNNKPVLLKAASYLVEMIEPLTATEPEIVSEVCQSLLKAAGSDIGNPATPLAYLAEVLTTIAITLHRQPTHREVGLQIFEELLALNLRETRSALETLDRNPNRRGYIPPRPRRLRRRRAS
jgi:hypothetical protein